MGRGSGASRGGAKGTRGGMGRGRFYFDRGQRDQSADRSPDDAGISTESLSGRISGEELTTLKARDRDLEEQLKAINEHIRKLEGSGGDVPEIAIVDADRCISCGICEWACPNGAISIGEIACIDSTKCTGCGLCIEKCPQRALLLRQT